MGDQLLVCDGVSLLEVTHDEAAQALKDAMDMESVGFRYFGTGPQGRIQDLKEGEAHTLCHRRKEAGDRHGPLYSIATAFVGYTWQ